jgi:hypothetical protein
MHSAKSHRGKIFGVGFGRTGTTSLAAALQLLGLDTLRSVDYSVLLSEFLPEEKVFCGPRLFKILDGHQAVTNGTGLPYKDLDRRYPGSKFILTVREKNSWLASQRAYRAFQAERQVSAETRAEQRLIDREIYGAEKFDAGKWIAAYDNQVKDVLDYFRDRPNDFLVMDISGGDGWEKLCLFLSCSVPGEPFPHTNDMSSVSAWAVEANCILLAVRKAVTPNRPYILVQGDDLPVADPYAIPVLEQNGQWWGFPADDETAIEELQRQRQTGTASIVFVKDTFWFRDSYPQFWKHLRSTSRCTVDSEDLIVFDLQREQTT